MIFEISSRGRSCFPWSVNFLGFFFLAFEGPNPIKFGPILTNLKKGDPEDFVVLVTLCIIFGMYFIGLVLARRADKNDKRKECKIGRRRWRAVNNVYFVRCMR